MTGAVPAELQARIAAAAPDLPLSFRPMFGGIMGYSDGLVFASLSNVGLAFKFAGSAHDAAMALNGAAALRYEPDSPASKTYVVMPAAVVGDDQALRQWLDTSIAGLKPRTVKPQRGAGR